MKSQMCHSRRTSFLRPLQLLVVGLVAGALLFASGCGNDTPGETSCEAHEDCEIGTVCGADGTCIETACSNCKNEEGLVCLTTDDNPQGVCSRPECKVDSDCTQSDESCDDGVCSTGDCENDSDCDDGFKCSVFNNQCVPESDAGMPDAGVSDGGSDDGGTGDTGAQGDGGSGDTSSAGDTTVKHDGGNCANKRQCPPSNSPQATLWSSKYCACVECHGDGDCSGNDTCKGGICRGPCQTSCTGSGPNCPSDKPYCIAQCCSECVGQMDCSGNEVCIDGVCSKAPEDCSQNPGSCPTDHKCNTSTGKCEKKTSGQMCSSNNPQSCPQGEFCDPQTNTCQAPSGGQQCGMCGANCMCPGNSTCQQFICTGCQLGQGDCPQGQTCLPGFNICFSLSM